ncbi:MAG: NADH-quinone oxidoreductase subunit N [Thermoanaerobaculales bacterium]|nr:NADH-quinone oxidoreductase subunit N [Thermoanaerobaculales bacterium]
MLFVPSSSDFLAILPEIILTVSAAALLLFSISARPFKRYVGEITLFIIVVAGWARLTFPLPGKVWGGTIQIDAVSSFVDLYILAAVFVCVWSAGPFLRRAEYEHTEFYSLLLLATVGAMVMASAVDALPLFLGLELLSLPLYALTAFLKRTSISLEAGLKYFVVGAFASAFVVYGLALLYGATGTTNLVAMGHAVRAMDGLNPLLALGLAGVVGGFAFKLALFPFHSWAPDVWQGSPTPVTAFLSVVPKGAVLIALFRLVDGMDLLILSSRWLIVGSILAIGSQFLGNFAAIVQRDIKRMLAYSGIAHMGYAMVAVIVAGLDGGTGVLVYMSAYTLMNIGAFAVVAFFSIDEGEAHLISDLQAQGWHRPIPALALTICLFSLAGIPPLFGFTAKFMVFGAAVNGGFVWLAVIGVVNSLVSAFCYLRVVYVMYMKPESSIATEFSPSFTLTAAAALTAVGVFVIGLYPTPILTAARVAALNLVR